MSNQAVGIDLGTTFSAVAQVNRHGVPEIIQNAEGDRITPSVVLFDEDEILVGNFAAQSAAVYPDQVVEFVKRRMGDPDYRFRYRDQSHTAPELSSFILRKLKHDAEMRLGHPVTQAVITVPAYFGDRQRLATMEAGRLAGLEVLRLINEPTAAALAYGIDRERTGQRILVYDLGGGTFDVTVCEANRDAIDVIATMGDHQLGGKDWDDALIRYAAEAFRDKHGIDPLADLAALHDLRQKCLSAKLSLSRRPRVNLFYDHQGHVLRLAITREFFEDLTAGLLRRTELLTLDVLEEAGLEPGQIDVVLLAGGSTRMPMVRDLLARMFGKPPAADINPDECVAMGAALTAAIESARLEGRAPDIPLRTHDVASHSLGMVVYREGRLHNSKIIRRNTRIPTERTRDDYVTTHDDQTTIDLWLIQGENPDPLLCSVLGHFEFYGIPPRPAGASQLAVTYRYNADGIVEVEAMDLRSGQTLAHRTAGGDVTLEDLAHNRAPIQVAIVLDASGSVYGTAFEEARRAVEIFLERTLDRPGRGAALVTVPGGTVVPPTPDARPIREALARTVAIGSSRLGEGLRRARETMRPRAGIHSVYVVVTDGRVDDRDAAMAEVHRIRTAGGRILAIGVGDTMDTAFLREIVARPEDFQVASDEVGLDGIFINLATERSRAGAG